MQKRGLGKGLSALISDNSSPSQEVEGAVQQVPTAEIEPNPLQPRTLFDPEKMADLAASVREHGILQPVLVRRMAPGRYQLVAGERRFRAAVKAGLAAIPVIVVDCTEREQLELAVVENLQREDIGAMEAARAYRRLIDEFEMTQDTVAQRVGKSRSSIANVLRLLRLPEEVQASVETGEISEGHARALMLAEFEQAILFAWNETKRKRLSVRDTERISKRSRDAMASGGLQQPVTRRPGAQALVGAAASSDPNEADIADRIQQAFGTKVTIRRTSGTSGRIEIEFYSNEDLARVADILLAGPSR